MKTSSKRVSQVVVFTLLSAFLLIQAQDASASLRRHSHRFHKPYRSHHVYHHRLPHHYSILWIAGSRYYYFNKKYHKKGPKGYVVVTPVVKTPAKTVVVEIQNPNGSYLSITLKKRGTGYVGPQGEFYPYYPSVKQLKALYADEPGFLVKSREPKPNVILVPNANGSYTPVQLTRKGQGYVGPQGEYYEERPNVEQLEIMYSKE